MSVETTAPRWGSIADAVAEHGVGQSTLYRWITQGRVRAERIGPRRVRVDLDSLSGATSPGLPTPTQLVAALAALDQADVDAIACVAGKIVPAADGSAITFAHIWQAIGAVARVQAAEAAPRA